MSVDKDQEVNAVEEVQQPKFYEMDGALRAYANRSLVIAGIMGTTALVAVVGFLFVRMQPPTVIKVDGAGDAQVITQTGASRHGIIPAVLASAHSSAPDEYERQAFLKQFLGHYLSYDPHTLSQNWADSINMMTANLRRTALNQMQKDNTVGKLEDEQALSTLRLSHIEATREDPNTYQIFGVRTVHRMVDNLESTEKLVEQYHVRLVGVERSAENPNGLLIGEYWAKQIEGEKRNAVLQGTSNAPTINDQGAQ